jgi:hypothetical protein
MNYHECSTTNALISYQDETEDEFDDLIRPMHYATGTRLMTKVKL